MIRTALDGICLTGTWEEGVGEEITLHPQVVVELINYLLDG